MQGAALASRGELAPAGLWADSPRAVSQRQRLQHVFGAPAPVVQRKIRFVGPGVPEGPDWRGTRKAVHAALLALSRTTKGEPFASFAARMPDDEHFGSRLIELAHDPIEHGIVSLDNPQQLALLLHEVMRIERLEIDAIDLNEALLTALNRERNALKLAENDPVLQRLTGGFQHQWVRDAFLELKIIPPDLDPQRAGAYKDGQVFDAHDTDQLKRVHAHLGAQLDKALKAFATPATGQGEEPVWHTAYLGAGAAVAYHMVANKLDSRPLDTIVIGKTQPWKPGGKEDRAFSSVNHPMGWIAPESQTVAHPDGFAPTADFSQQIDAVIKAHSVVQVEAELGSQAVRKAQGHPWYEIRVGSRTYRARHVVSALGIGKHKPPDTFAEHAVKGENSRVLDMDEFHRQLRDEKSTLNQVRKSRGPEFRIALSGPNAGVDVAYTATKAGIPVLWFTSSGPYWVKGFANYGIKADLLTIVLARLQDYKPVGQIGLTLTSQPGKPDEKMQKTLQALGVNTVLSEWSSGDVYDYLVYAVGPDDSASGALESTLQERLKKAPIADKDHRFSGSRDEVNPDTKAKGHQAPDIEAMEKGQDTFFWGKLRDWFAARGDPQADATAWRAWDRMYDILGHLRPVAALPAKADKVTLNLRVADTDGTSFEIVGAQAPRLDKNIETGMRPVVDSLPPTVVGNDQLTPSRSRAYASGHSMPGHLGKARGGVDLVTDDQVAIAMFIASTFDLPPYLADYVTRRIIDERRGVKKDDALGKIDPDTGVRPGFDKTSAATFDARWMGRLQQLHALFG